MSDTEEGNEETLATFEEQQRKKEQRLEQELAEYTEARKAEKEREASEIEELKRKREERKKERAEEEKRLAIQRKEEDARRKIEEEERKKKKAEEEEKRRREKERRRLEAERRKGPKTPNFTIVKKEGGDEKEEEHEKKPPQKSKEELEKEKQTAIASRITPMPDVGSLSADQLKEEAKKLHEQLWNLVSNMYNLEERYKRQQYDIVELQERARAMSKTKKKGVASVQYDDSYDRMNDRFSNAPPKILVANKYEANLDRRSWKEKVDTYNLKEDLTDMNKLYNDYMAIIDETYDFTGGL